MSFSRSDAPAPSFAAKSPRSSYVIAWVVTSSVLIMLIALSGGSLLALRRPTARVVIIPLVTAAAGSLIGSAERSQLSG